MASSTDDIESISEASSVKETISASSGSFSLPPSRPSTQQATSQPLPPRPYNPPSLARFPARTASSSEGSLLGSPEDIRAEIRAHFEDLPPLFQGWVALRVGPRRWEERYCGVHPVCGIFTFESAKSCAQWAKDPVHSEVDASCIIESLLNVRLEVEAKLNDEVSGVTKGDYTIGLRLSPNVVIGTSDADIAELAQALNQSSHIRSYFETCVILHALPVASVLHALANPMGPVRHRQFSILDRQLSVDECASLSLLLTDKVEHLVLCNCGLYTQHVMAMYSGYTQLSALKELDLGENLLDADALQLLSKALSVSASSSLTTIDLSLNPLEDAGAAVLASLLQLTPHLSTLRLRQVGLSSSGVKQIGFACARVPFLSCVDLSYNAVGGEGMSALCAALRTLVSLHRLTLICCDLADMDLSNLRQALRVNMERSVVNGVAQVELQGNTFSATAVMALLDAGPIAKRIKLGDAQGDRAVVKRNIHPDGSVKIAILYSSVDAKAANSGAIAAANMTVLRLGFKSFAPEVLKLLTTLAGVLDAHSSDLSLAFRRDSPPCVGVRLSEPLAQKLSSLHEAGDPRLTLLQVKTVEPDRPGLKERASMAKLEELQRELLERPIRAEELLERSGISRPFLCDELVASLKQTLVHGEEVTREEADTILRTVQLLKGDVGDRFSPFLREVVKALSTMEAAQLHLLKAMVHALQGRVETVLSCFDQAKHGDGQPITAEERMGFSDAVLQSTTIANQSSTFVEIYNVESAALAQARSRRTKAFRLAAVVADELGRLAAQTEPIEPPPNAQGYLLSLDAPQDASLLQDPEIAHELLGFEGLRRDLTPSTLALLLRYIPGKRDTLLTQVLTRMQPHAANMSSLLQHVTGELEVSTEGINTPLEPLPLQPPAETTLKSSANRDVDKERGQKLAALLGEALALASLDRSKSLTDELHVQLAAQLIGNPKPVLITRVILVSLRLARPSKKLAQCMLQLLERLERESNARISKAMNILVHECRDYLNDEQSEAGALVLADPRIRQQVVTEVITGQPVVLRILLGNGKGVKLKAAPLTSFRNLLGELDDRVSEMARELDFVRSTVEPNADYRWHGMGFFSSTMDEQEPERVKWTKDAHWWRWETLLDLCQRDRLTHGAAQSQLQLELRAFVSPQFDYFKSKDPVRMDLLFAHAYQMLVNGELGTVRPGPLGYVCAWVAAIKNHATLSTFTTPGFLECALEYLPRPLARRYASLLDPRTKTTSGWKRVFLKAARVVWEAFKPEEVSLGDLKSAFVQYIALWPLGLGITFREVRYDKNKPTGRMVINKNGVFVLASASRKSKDGDGGLHGLVVPWHSSLTDLKKILVNPEEELVLEHARRGSIKLKVNTASLSHVKGTIIAHVTAGIVHLGQLSLSSRLEMQQLSHKFPFLADTIMRPPDLYHPNGTVLALQQLQGDLGARLATVATLLDDQLG